MNETVVADKTESAPPATDDASGAQTDDLDTLLAGIDQDFDKGTQADSAKDTKDSDAKNAALTQRVAFLEEKETTADVDGAVKVIQENMGDLQLPDRAVRGMLNEMALEDPRMMKAFQNRGKDPVLWNSILKSVGPSIVKEFSGQVDRGLTDDRAALTAALSGTSNVKGEDDSQKFKRFAETATDMEFDEMKRTGKIPKSYSG